MNPIADLLTRAKARALAHPCKGTYSRDTYGAPIPPRNPWAVCWCALGALYREASSLVERLVAIALLSTISERLTGKGPGFINDERPDLIPQMFDLAIEEAFR